MLKNSNTKNLIMVVILLTAGIAGYFASKQYFDEETNNSYESLLTFPQQKNFSGFSLHDKNNKTVNIESFAGHWTLIFFGYTHCPDVCPTTLSELQKTYKILESQNLNQLPEVLFISVDPERDTSQSLNDYINFFNPKFNAATADNSNILSITSQIGAAYHIQTHTKDDNNYAVDHTAAVFLINPKKQLYGLFRSPHNSSKISHDLIQLIGKK